ncbi:MAG: DNA replication/repair protein RecF [Proteobacteria bacterium]|nr:DNA replication/repair protein RecF [Pseudomonadota bacterium]
MQSATAIASLPSGIVHPTKTHPHTQQSGFSGGYRVWLKHLRLTRFRNYSSADLPLVNQPIVLTGANGSGKSNLLEAISLLAPGRGMRRAKNDHLPYTASWHSPANDEASGDSDSDSHTQPSDMHTSHTWRWAVVAEVMTPHGSMRIGSGQQNDQESQAKEAKRERRLDGVSVSQTQIAQCLAVSWLTPNMDGILAASPSERRRFLDRLVIAFDAAHAGRLTRYERSMRQRNKLLEEGSTGGWLDATEHELATTGVAICAARLAMVAALNDEASTPQLVFPQAHVSLTGEVEEWLASMPAIDAEDRMRHMSAQRRETPTSSSSPAANSMPGPHNTLVVATHPATGRTGEQSSTGELKSLLISIVLAHARLQAKRLTRPPLLLLDDITSHMDDKHRHALFELTASLHGQVWFTATDKALFDPIKNQALMVTVDNGHLTPSHKESHAC